MNAVRWALGSIGVLVAGYGGWLLGTRQAGDQLVSAAQWLVAGVIVHDLLLAPVVLVLVAVAARLLPHSARAPVAVLLVVVGSVTLMAVPVLGGFGRRPDNPSLLDRDYVAGWLVLVAVLGAAVAVGWSMQRWRRRDGADPGR